MKVLQINAVPYGSTGKIMFSLADQIESEGGECLCTSGFTWKKPHRDDFFQTSNIFEKELHTIQSYITGNLGGYSKVATKKLIKKIDEFKPDIVHLHNIHGWFVNYELLFAKLKEINVPIVWTLHDCWSFTGQCPHFTMIGCNKWKTKCENCQQFDSYPKTRKDFSSQQFERKKDLFTSLNNLTIVTPSHWLEGLVKESFLNKYPIEVIHNGINLNIFKPTNSNFRQKYNLKNKYVLLGVSYEWNIKKGLDVFIELSKQLDEQFQIVLIGTDDEVDKQLPKNIISIHRTQNQEELAEIYTAADLFINPTREDNFPTVNMEAVACGTPVITFNTGGCLEIIDKSCGSIIPCDDIEKLKIEIETSISKFDYKDCIKKASNFTEIKSNERYLKLYRRLVI
ncbi:glycosyltransferase [Floccifex sp.]|uniref:glycosyltransferase n=1 Tax=Floccifex sp. TaxID=2815810 RepID=UPI002A763933|nr:glycosyltransferase [Floccifex sp.]MDY2957679.1 glycosyltransferase [Floccifex sp.]